MRYIIVASMQLLIFVSAIFAGGQTPDKCDSNIIIKARDEGLRTLKLTEIFDYWYACKKCKNDNPNFSKVISRIEAEQIESDYQSSHTMKGFTSSFSYFISMTMIIYFTDRIINSN